MNFVRWGEVFAIGLLLAMGALMLTAVQYSGGYAINDDWGYSTPIFWWGELGVTRLTNWQSMPLVPQLLLGSVWAEIFGYSQSSLRQLTIVFSVAVCISIFVIGRLLAVSTAASLLCAMLPLASPIFFGLSYTFMTDIPASAFALGSLIFFVRFLISQNDRYSEILIGILILLVAVLIRQTSIGIALAFGIVFIATRGVSIRTLVVCSCILLLPIAAYLAVTEILRAVTGLPLVYQAKSSGLIHFFQDLMAANFGALRKSVEAFLRLSEFIGLFMAPLVPMLWWQLRTEKRFLLGAVLAAGFLTFASMFLNSGVFAIRGDVLTRNGIGPRLIAGTETTAPFVVTLALTFIGHLVSMAATAVWANRFLSLSTVGSDFSSRKRSALAMLFLAAIIVFGPHATAYAAVFDRYTVLPAILISIVTLSALQAHVQNRRGFRQAFISVLALVSVSLFLTRDFFAWQDARYALISRFTGTGVAHAQEIDGGFEYNNLGAIFHRPQDAVGLPLVDASDRPIFLTESPETKDVVLDMISVNQFFGAREATIYAVQRQGHRLSPKQ